MSTGVREPYDGPMSTVAGVALFTAVSIRQIRQEDKARMQTSTHPHLLDGEV